MGVDNPPDGTKESGFGRAIINIWSKIISNKKWLELAPNLISDPSILGVDYKPSWLINNVAEFFSHTRRLLAEIPNLPYPEDGLMYIPVDVIYNPRSNDIPISKRQLTEVPDTCKWKPPSKITIDFVIQWNLGEQSLLLKSGQRSASGRVELTEFTGSPDSSAGNEHMITTSPPAVDVSNALLHPGGAPLPSGTVVEFAWDEQLARLVPQRIRFDKPGPNMLDVAQDNWEVLRDPLTAEDITGTTLKLAFKYHSKLKRDLFRAARQPGQNMTILDIGSGRGGDIDKWRLLGGKVVAVEPNADNRSVLQDRLISAGLQDQVRIIASTGEDSATITQAVRQWLGGPADVISIMLSLSFFWESHEHLAALVQTIIHNIKPDGQVLFFTIDGDSVQQLFEPTFGGQVRSDIMLANGRFVLHAPPTRLGLGRMLEIDIPNTIMGRQQEYLVMLDDLTLRLAAHGFVLEEFHRAGAPQKIRRQKYKLIPPFLSTEQAIYNNLFSWGRYRLHGTVTLATDSSSVVISTTQPSSSDTMISSPPPAPTLPAALPTSVPVTLSPPISPLPTSVPVTSPVPDVTPSTVTSSVTVPAKVTLATVPATVSATVSATMTPTTIPTIVFPTVSEVVIPPVQPPPVTSLPLSLPKHNVTNIPLSWPTFTATALLADNAPLPILPVVSQPGRAGRAPGDDIVKDLVCTWQDRLVRIATIGDGSCFIHALLKAISANYQEDHTFVGRSRLAKYFRRDLALLLNQPDSRYPGHVYWETANQGAFVTLFATQVFANDRTVVDEVVDYGVLGLQRMFNSSYYLGNEVYGFVTELLNVNLCVLQATNKDLLNHSYDRHDPQWPTIIIIGNTGHYEVVGLRTDSGIQTVFPPDDPLVVKLAQRFSQDPRQAWHPDTTLLNMLLNYPDEHLHPRLPDGSLDMESFDFTHIHGIINNIFSESDPFLKLLRQVIQQLRERGHTVVAPANMTNST